MKLRIVVYVIFLIVALPVFGRGESSFKFKKIAYIGDSLTEGYGVNRESAYPAVVEGLLKKQGVSVSTINAGVSGATSASALSSVRWVSRSNPDLYVLALGANDGLRGIDPETMKANLKSALDFLKSKTKAQVLFVGMKAPPNMGRSYTSRFEKAYLDLAESSKVTFIPFLLDGVAARKDLNQGDGIHPNIKGHEIVAALIYKKIYEMGKKSE